jgi:hypothetical protein
MWVLISARMVLVANSPTPGIANKKSNQGAKGHYGFMLRLYLRQYDAAADAIAEIDMEVDAVIAKMNAEGQPVRPTSTHHFE